MANNSLTNFLGMTPRFEHHLLQNTAAYSAIDVDTWSGGLVPFRRDSLVQIVDKEYKDLYLYRDDTRQQWLLFDSKVDIVRSPQQGDVGSVCYLTGIQNLKVFDSSTLGVNDKTITLTNSYDAGIPVPATPTLTRISSTNTGASSKTVSYLITYMRQWSSGRQDYGPASLPAATSAGLTYIDVDASNIGQISNIVKSPNVTYDHTNWVIIYRSVIGTEDAIWQEVVRFATDGSVALPSSVTAASNKYTFKDTIADTALGSVLTSENYTMPAGLQGITTLHNGILAAFVKNILYFSVPWIGHAWPEDYSLPLDFDIVGLGSFGNTLVVCTVSNTYMCVVSDPANVILTPLQEAQSCVSKDSIVSLRDSVVYASTYGLIQVSANGATNITEGIIGPVRWGDYNAPSIYAACYEGNYLFYFTNNDLEYTGALVNLADISYGLLGFSTKPVALWHDDVSSNVYVLYTNYQTGRTGIYKFGASYSRGKVFTWISKKFLNNQGLTTLSTFKLNFYPEYTLIKVEPFVYTYSQGCLNAPIVNVFSVNGDANTWPYIVATYGAQQCNITVYGDDAEWTTFIVDSNDFVRIPAGRRFDSWYCKITSTVPIMRVQFATSAMELE